MSYHSSFKNREYSSRQTGLDCSNKNSQNISTAMVYFSLMLCIHQGSTSSPAPVFSLPSSYWDPSWRSSCTTDPCVHGEREENKVKHTLAPKASTWKWSMSLLLIFPWPKHLSHMAKTGMQGHWGKYSPPKGAYVSLRSSGVYNTHSLSWLASSISAMLFHLEYSNSHVTGAPPPKGVQPWGYIF